MKQKIFMLIMLSILIFQTIPVSVGAVESVSARNAILMEQHTGRVLYEKKAHEPERIASITKIMTAILAIESGKLREKVKVSNRASGTEGSSLYLKVGEEMLLEDLVYGLMLRSGNDAAVAIAEHVGGSLEGFVFLMNQKALELGMANTRFANPHGLDDHEDHYSTAYDMALLTKYAINNEKYKEIAGTKVHRAPNPNESWDYVWRNKNRLLTDLYRHATGGKTGYTKRAKRTLVTTAAKGDFEMIAVTLNGPDDWNDHIHMFETGFAEYDIVEVLPEGGIKSIVDPHYKDRVYLEHAIIYPLTAEEQKLVNVEYKLLKPQRDGEVREIVGKAVVYVGNNKIKEVPIFYRHSVDEKKSFYDYFKNIFTSVIGLRADG
ncbi:D-alanyl-D-alanine carboxypeptidase family protein [Bacillus sp. B15-48]|uniref:D-alanyl-D-alanine carboxypeptidase family protein n=1 Tax=Bacillus sp. B15-48 TaxID=1548601 RepID=UPI00193F6D9B|nr:D-alanyl-D-alanine carboxypeptidase family protein [Bacillus sp. B15-48]MBM4762170.1 D-alanyl-D-alanine carboxypeptidase [Bacillus sp. B15-48]